MFNSVEEVHTYVNNKIAEHLNNKNVRVIYSNKMRTTLATCSYNIKLNKYTLKFNYNYIKENYNNGNVVQNTVLHEIAHAIVGVEQGHNSYWKQTHIRIGGNGERLAKSSNIIGSVRKSRKEQAKYKVTCLGCGKTYYYLRKCNSLDHAELWTCITCGNKFKVECIK